MDFVYSLKVDSSWNLYVWWMISDSVTIWSTQLISQWSYDWYVAKYNSSWNELWAKWFGWSDSDYVYSLAVDTSWNVYIWGWFTSTISAWSFNLNNVIQPSDSFVVKYDSSGNVTWLKRISSEQMASNIQYIWLTKVNAFWWIPAASDSTYINSIFVDNNWYVYLWWNFSQQVSITVWSVVLYWNGTSISWFAIKYNSDLE